MHQNSNPSKPCPKFIPPTSRGTSFGGKLNLILSSSIYKKKYSLVVTIVLALIFFSSTSFYLRFTVVFGIHRTFPVICVLVSCWVLFKIKSEFFQKYLETPVLILCGVISQFSFANGGFLWIIMIGACFYKMKKNFYRKRKYTTAIILSALVSTYSYLIFFDGNHAKIFVKNTFNEIDIFSVIIYTIDYLTGFVDFSFYRPLELIIKIAIVSIYGIIFVQFLRGNRLETITAKIKRSCEIFIYIASFFITVPILNAISRGYKLVPNRYYVELTMFSVSVYIIFYLIASISKTPLLKYYLLVSILICLIPNLRFSNSLISIQMLRSVQPYEDVKIVQCIRRAEQASYDVLYDKCKLAEKFWHFRKGSENKHPSIKISDPEQYSKMVFRVFRGE